MSLNLTGSMDNDCLLTDCCLADLKRLLDIHDKALLAKLEAKLDLVVTRIEELLANQANHKPVKLTELQ